MKHLASRPKTPSTDTTSGVNEARCASAAPVIIITGVQEYNKINI